MKQLTDSFWLRPTRAKRIALFLLLDVISVVFALYAAFWLRFDDGNIARAYLDLFPIFITLSILLKIPVFYLQGFYRMSWSFISLNEVLSLVKGVAYSSLLLGTVYFIWGELAPSVWYPRSVILIDFGLTMFLVGVSRMGKRIYLQLRRKPFQGSRTLIVGAGSAGEQLVRGILNQSPPEQWPIGLVDDDPAKRDLSMHGVRVLGKCNEIGFLVEKHDIETVFIAMPSAPSDVIRSAVDQAREAGVPHVKILPPLSELISGKVEMSQLRELNLEDLLGRSTVTIDTQAIEAYLTNKIVLVTGASGSIGSQLCRQIAGFKPQMILALDNNESGLFDLDVDIKKEFPELQFELLIGDVREPKKIDAIFAKFQPQVIFHAAAYKHVHLMEKFPEESVHVNVIGTKIVAEAALKHKAENFVLISTDKAVNPPNVYGATKRLAETMIVLLNHRSDTTRFSAVRFGNVLGSRGSVVPLFEEQIKHRGPVTITDPAMKRYFMVTSEALRLVLQASTMGEGGEVFVLDMGEPVMILDMAKELIRLHGYEPDKDIPIVFTGIRPGEKLFEDLLTAEEGTQATQHKRVFTARLSSLISDDQLWHAIDAYQEGKVQGKAEIVSWLKELVPEFQPIEN